MRVINFASVICPENWPARAEAAVQAERTATETMILAIEAGQDSKVALRARNASINRKDSIWQEYKEPMKVVSSRKCWYCEVDTLRADGAVDHFRPKSHYFWSAFRATNFRYSCTFCNSRRVDIERNITEGKGDFFPLLDPNSRATCLEDELNEVPLLIDPCSPNEPSLICFQDDGHSVPKYTHEQHEIRHLKAKKSIEYYHLNHTDLKDSRLSLQATLVEKINEANTLYPRVDAGDPYTDRSFNSLTRELARAIHFTAEFSVFARTVIAGFRNLVWFDELLQVA